MDILTINIDSKKIPNLALEKVKLYYRGRGDTVHEDLPFMAGAVDKIYVSVIFTENREQASEWLWWDQAEIGGTGYDIKSRLPKEIEKIIPRINLGFITRGCNRKCPFCVVPEKEGKVYQEAEIRQIWDGKAGKVTLLDNNILFDKRAFIMTCEDAIMHKLELDFNQGLDYRLLDDDICHYLSKTKHKHWRFAWDNPGDELRIRQALKLLKKYKISNSTWYVLVGFDTNWEDDLYRVEMLREMGESVFVMRYQKVRDEKRYIRLSQWTALHNIFKKVSFEQFCEMKGGLIYDPNV